MRKKGENERDFSVINLSVGKWGRTTVRKSKGEIKEGEGKGREAKGRKAKRRKGKGK